MLPAQDNNPSQVCPQGQGTGKTAPIVTAKLPAKHPPHRPRLRQSFTDDRTDDWQIREPPFLLPPDTYVQAGGCQPPPSHGKDCFKGKADLFRTLYFRLEEMIMTIDYIKMDC